MNLYKLVCTKRVSLVHTYTYIHTRISTNNMPWLYPAAAPRMRALFSSRSKDPRQVRRGLVRLVLTAEFLKVTQSSVCMSARCVHECVCIPMYIHTRLHQAVNTTVAYTHKHRDTHQSLTHKHTHTQTHTYTNTHIHTSAAYTHKHTHTYMYTWLSQNGHSYITRINTHTCT